MTRHPPQWTMGRARMRWIARTVDDAARGCAFDADSRAILGWAFARKLDGANRRWPVAYLRELAGTELWADPLLGWLRAIAPADEFPDPQSAIDCIEPWPPGLADSEAVYMGHARQKLIAHGLADGACAASAYKPDGPTTGDVEAIGFAVAAELDGINGSPAEIFRQTFENRVGRFAGDPD